MGTPIDTVDYIYGDSNWGDKLTSYDGKTITGPMADTMGQHNQLRYRGYVYDPETGLYFLNSRFYDPETGRFINSDIFAATGQGLLGNNMYAYCGNNPVIRTDANGCFWDIVFDIVSLVVSVIEVINDPTDAGAWLGLACDVVDVVVPCVGGLGELTRAATNTLDVIDSVHDTSRMIDNTGDIIDTAGDVARKTDFYITPNGEAIPGNLDEFYDNLSMLDNRNGKYVGVDSNGPIRIRPNEIHPDNPDFTGTASQYHTVPHFHIDRRSKGTTGDWVSTYVGLMEMFN